MSDDPLILHGARDMLTHWPKADGLRELIDETERALEEDSDRSIDCAKCLVEAACKTILEDRGQGYDEKKVTAVGLVKLASRWVGLEGKEAGDPLVSLLNGLAQIGQALSELRNSHGVVGHGREGHSQRIGRWHRIVAVRAAETIVVLLCEAHLGKEQNFKSTRFGYDEKDPVHEQIDFALQSEFDDGTGEITVGELYRIRPSQILYDYDRNAYLEARQGISDLADEEMDA